MANRFDLHIQALKSARTEDTSRFMGFGYVKALGVKGFQQLINQWLLTLLTPQGGDPADLARGTSFDILIGSNFSVNDARDIVVLSIQQCNDQVGAFQVNDFTLTPSERLASAELIEFVPQPSDPGFRAVVEIKNQANESLQFNLPSYADGD